jgi:hypothetical protein
MFNELEHDPKSKCERRIKQNIQEKRSTHQQHDPRARKENKHHHYQTPAFQLEGGGAFLTPRPTLAG